METRLHQFCHEFDTILAPLGTPLRQAVDITREEAALLSVKDELPTLMENQHKLELLTEKIRRQQAYVLIFGPLKSGKSTLMNAITGKYVSEVTALPGYPCLVYVSDAAKPEYEITRYDGSTEKLTDLSQFRQRVEQAHQRLSEEVRRFEAGTEQTKKERRATKDAPDSSVDEFDPAVHYSQAMRKLDVRIPAGDLEESGAVLVDTPGLYSRMKFGYDRMTRDFRDTAACAVFVVKTDNLFLDHVFAEFEELLQLFDRIFLVVNLDSNKKDLMPDGSLKPSLERENPEEIIDAFTKLSMSAPLRTAAEEGRLQIYPVDLLHAASRRLSDAGSIKSATSPPPATAAKPAAPADKKPATAADTPAAGSNGANDKPPFNDGFDKLRDDITGYLNSNDYITAFMSDSLRYADNMLASITGIGKTDAVRKLQKDRAALEESVADGDALQKAIDQITESTVTKEQRADVLREPGESFWKATGEANAKAGKDALSGIQWAVQNWFAGDDSLEQLTAGHVGKLSTKALHDTSETALDQLELTTKEGGLSLPKVFRADLDRASIDPEEIAREVLKSIGKPDDATVEIDAPYDDIPVRKNITDWLLFRTLPRLRKRIFGYRETPDLPVSQQLKLDRLGEPAQEYLESFIRGALSSALPVKLTRRADALWDQFATGFFAAVKAKTDTLRQETAEALAENKEKLAVLQRVGDAFRELGQATDQSRLATGTIRKQFKITGSGDKKKPDTAAKAAANNPPSTIIGAGSRTTPGIPGKPAPGPEKNSAPSPSERSGAAAPGVKTTVASSLPSGLDRKPGRK